MEYVNLDIGIPALVGEPTIVAGNTMTSFTPTTKPVYRSSTFETENIANFFVEIEVGEVALWKLDTAPNPDVLVAVDEGVQFTVWTQFGSDWKRFFMALNQTEGSSSSSRKYIINSVTNSGGTNCYAGDHHTASVNSTPLIGNRTYITVEPSGYDSYSNPIDFWEWMDGTKVIDDVNQFAGHVEIKSVTAYLMVNN